MKLYDLLQDVSYTALSPADPEITDVIYDSRKVTQGTAFVCLKGYTSDGHQYAQSAVENGAAALVISDDLDFEVPENVAVIKTEDTRLALALMSRRYFGIPEQELITVAITGTKGKTTTAILLSGILSENGIPCAYIGSNGIDIGPDHYETVNTTPKAGNCSGISAKWQTPGITMW